MRLLYQSKLADVYEKKNGKMEISIVPSVFSDQQVSMFPALEGAGKKGSGQSRNEGNGGFPGGKNWKVQGVEKAC